MSFNFPFRFLSCSFQCAFSSFHLPFICMHFPFIVHSFPFKGYGTGFNGVIAKSSLRLSLNKPFKWLVGGAITILKNMSSSMGRIIPDILENKQCLKPPTRWHCSKDIFHQTTERERERKRASELDAKWYGTVSAGNRAPKVEFLSSVLPVGWMCTTVFAWFTPSLMDCHVRSQVIAFGGALSPYSV